MSHFDDHLLNAAATKTLSHDKIKYVAPRVLLALNTFPEDGFVHAAQYDTTCG